MKKHVLIALMIGGCFEVAGTAALDLDTTSGFLLDVLHVGTAMTDYLSSQVETVNRFEVNGNLLLGPFPLQKMLVVNEGDHDDGMPHTRPYSSRSTGG
jgi:hypothetical protein